MKTLRQAISLSGLIVVLGLSRSASAQGIAEPTAGLTAQEAIEAEFQRDLVRIEKVRIERLATLAASQPKAEAAKTYENLFRFAIAVGLYGEAEPIAERVLGLGDATTEVTLLAEMVNVVAEANRGAYQDSLKSLATAIQINGADPTGKLRRELPLPARLSLVNVYTQRLVREGQYDVARKALTMIRDSTKDAAVKNLVVSRLMHLELIGKTAPPISGTDLDSKPLKLEDYKGEVVFMVFWASWCLPNAQEAALFGEIAARYRDKGFRVIGINVDSMQDGGIATETVMPNVRRFLIDHNVRWPNLMNGTGEHDYAKAYGVNEIPSNVLIGRDGKIIQLDLNRVKLAEAVSKALAP